MWLNLRVDKRNGILCSDWIPERVRWAHLACSGFSALIPQEVHSLAKYKIIY